MHNLFAAILAKGISRQLKQGLYREYLNRKEDVAVVRGKIDMPGTIQNRLARKRVLTCEYDELSENNLLNQILKTNVMLLLRHTRVDQEYKSDLKKEMLFFSNVDTIDPTTIRWSAIRFQRNNNTYRMLISLCQLILEGMLLTTDSGEYKLDALVACSQIIIDRARGSAEPRYPDFIYPVDYGDLEGTSSMDGNGIDVWGGSGEPGIDAVMCTVDLMKRDSEINIAGYPMSRATPWRRQCPRGWASAKTAKQTATRSLLCYHSPDSSRPMARTGRNRQTMDTAEK